MRAHTSARLAIRRVAQERCHASASLKSRNTLEGVRIQESSRDTLALVGAFPVAYPGNISVGLSAPVALSLV